jgi:hypothetical protein
MVESPVRRWSKEEPRIPRSAGGRKNAASAIHYPRRRGDVALFELEYFFQALRIEGILRATIRMAPE